MITKEEFTALNQHLQSIAEKIPYKWGRMQSRDIDRRLPKLFEYKTYDELNDAIARYVEKGFLSDNDDENNYYRHRWFVYKCSEVDEYLFHLSPDIVEARRFNLDLKGIVFFKQSKDDSQHAFHKPLAIIDSFYKEQKRDFNYRKRLQNRLFIAHHSFISPSREPLLRTVFGAKSIILEQYAKMLANPEHKIYDYMNGRKTDIIFLLENENGSLSYGFGSENLKGEIIIKNLL